MDEVTEGTLPPEDQPAGTEEVTPTEETTSAGEDRFSDLDPSEKPEGDITPEWLQERYKQMQADYTRKTQTISETAKQREEELQFLEALRSDPETQRAVLDELSTLLDESDVEEEPGEVDPTEAVSRQVQEIRDQLDQERAMALGREISSHIEQLASEAGVELDEDDFERIFGTATAEDSSIGKQNTEAAFKAWHEKETARRDKWLKSYLSSKEAPTQVPPGQPAQDKPDLSTHEGRVVRMKAILEGGS